jgi:hypothetical protein
MTVLQGAGPRVDVAAHGQLIDVPPGEYDWIQLRFAGDIAEGEQDEVFLHYRDGADPEWLHLAPQTRVPVPRHTTLVAFRLPDRPGLRLRGFHLIPARKGHVDG